MTLTITATMMTTQARKFVCHRRSMSLTCDSVTLTPVTLTTCDSDDEDVAPQPVLSDKYDLDESDLIKEEEVQSGGDNEMEEEIREEEEIRD